MKKDMNILFKRFLDRHIRAMEKNMIARIKKANDKDFVFRDIKKETAFYLKWLKSDQDKQDLIKTFIIDYKRGYDLNKTIQDIQETYAHSVEDVKSYQKKVGSKYVPVYITEEEKKLKEFALNDRKLIRYLIWVLANKEIQKRFKEIYEKATTVSPSKNDIANLNIKWTGTKEENKNEFVQLVYALHKAGFINKGKGEITKIVESLSEVFGVELGKSWQSNHSASIHKAKHNYEPPIFKKLKEAYREYTDGLIDDKKKNK